MNTPVLEVTNLSKNFGGLRALNELYVRFHREAESNEGLNDEARSYFKKIEDMNLRNPLMVGFGISNKATFQAACEHASGAIIGSRFVTLLEEEKDPEKAILKLKDALK